MRYILSLLFFCTVAQCSAQTDFINRSVIRRDSNFAFQKDRNVFAITGPRSGPWKLKANSCRIEPTDSPWLFIVEPSLLGPDTFFLIRKGKVVLTKVFQVIPWPGVRARWGVLQSDTASAPEVIANRKMMLYVSGGTDCPDFIIKSFDMDLVTAQLPDYQKEVRIDGNALTEDAAKLISKLAHGDKIMFSKIYLGDRDTRGRVLAPFTIMIK